MTAPNGKQSNECFDFYESIGVSEVAFQSFNVPSNDAVKNYIFFSCSAYFFALSFFYETVEEVDGFIKEEGVTVELFLAGETIRAFWAEFPEDCIPELDWFNED